MKRWHGARALVMDAIEHGSRAVERVQLEMAKAPFDLLEKVPGLKVPVSGVRLLYNTGVSSTHTMIRLTSKVVGDTVGAVMSVVGSGEPEAAGARERDDHSPSMQNSIGSPM